MLGSARLACANGAICDSGAILAALVRFWLSLPIRALLACCWPSQRVACANGGYMAMRIRYTSAQSSYSRILAWHGAGHTFPYRYIWALYGYGYMPMSAYAHVYTWLCVWCVWLLCVCSARLLSVCVSRAHFIVCALVCVSARLAMQSLAPYTTASRAHQRAEPLYFSRDVCAIPAARLADVLGFFLAYLACDD